MEYIGYVIIGALAFVLGALTAFLAFHIKEVNKEKDDK